MPNHTRQSTERAVELALLAIRHAVDELRQDDADPHARLMELQEAIWEPKRAAPGRAKPVNPSFDQKLAQHCWNQGFAAFYDGEPNNPYTSGVYAAAWRDGWEAAADEASDHAAKEAK